MTRVIDPVLADMQHEIGEAGRRGRARQLWMRAICYVAFWRVVAWHLAPAAARRAWAFPDDRSRSAVRVAALVFVVVTFLLVAPAGHSLQGRNVREQARLFALLLPQAVALSMPLAFFVGAVAVLWRRAVTPRVCRTIAVLGVATSLATFFTINELVPASGEAFRQALASRLTLEGRRYVWNKEPWSCRSASCDGGRCR